VKFRLDWDWAAAETEFRRALELKPGYARAHEWYGLFLAISQRFDEAMAEMRRAQQLDPLSASVSNGIGRILHFQRQYDAALGQFRQTLELEPEYAEAYFSMAMTYQMQRRYDDDIAALDKAMKLSPRPVMEAMRGLAHGLAGRKDQALKILDDMRARQPPVSSYYLGVICIGLPDFDRAMQYFEQAYAERDGILMYLAVDPVGEALWRDPRFAALVKKMGLQETR
jgi:tetratricopeptide (TPR) repeat protein